MRHKQHDAPNVSRRSAVPSSTRQKLPSAPLRLVTQQSRAPLLVSPLPNPPRAHCGPPRHAPASPPNRAEAELVIPTIRCVAFEILED